MSVVRFHSYADVLSFVQGRRDGAAARLRAHDRAVDASPGGSRVGRLTMRDVTLAQGELQALTHLLADLQTIEFEQ